MRDLVPPDATMTRGVWVEVRNGFNGQWSPGFVVVDVADGGYRLRRMRDGHVLPDPLPARDVRPIPRLR